MNMSRYVRLTRGLADKGILIEPSKVYDYVDDKSDYYVSTFYYNEEQFKRFKETGSIRGIKDVVTDKLWFDFDHEDDPEFARRDAIEVVNRLLKYKVKEQDIEIYFSGNKGYNVIVTLKRELTPDLCYSLAINKFGKGLDTLDDTLYDAAQILRVPGSRHQVSGLFKFPLTFKQLTTLDTGKIKSLATSIDNASEFDWTVANPDPKFFEVDIPKKEPKVKSEYTLDLSKKPKQWKNCKWSLLQGNFKSGERHQALLVLAATLRGLGYDKDTTYYMCKSALKKQAALSGQDEFPKEELWTNIIEQSVYTDGWEGGQYTCKKEGWLRTYCQSLGEHKCSDVEEEDRPCIEVGDMEKIFTNYAVNFEQNVIKTGIKGLDENVMFLASTHNGVLGQPGSGKTSFALEYLKNASMNDVNSVFLSLDMGTPIVFAKIVQKIIGCSFKTAMDIFKTDPKRARELTNIIKEQYKNVGFNFRAGLTVSDIKSIVAEQEDRTGKKVKLLVTDYLECLSGPYSDATANTGFISNQLKDLANEMSLSSVLLLQTQKHSVPDISDPLLTMKGIKGSSVIEQSCSLILTLWREGYNPRYVDDDRYISFAAVKNRVGSLWTGDFSWDGVRGDIRSLTEEQQEDLKEFRKRKKEDRLAQMEEADKGWQ